MSNSFLQNAGLAAYKGLVRSGIMAHPAARRLFLHAYRAYKALIEAGPIGRLEAFVQRGSIVVDVGANVGFFTTKFARWVGPSGQVLAIEPDHENFEALTRAAASAETAGRVRAIRAVAAEKPGTLFLERNEVHPGDHKIAVGASGTEVPAVSVDSVVADARAGHVSLIKIDVQGAEMMVLAGAVSTLSTHNPALFVEVDERALRHFGTSFGALVDFLEARGYRMHELTRDGAAPMSREDLTTRLAHRGYLDVLFVPPDLQTLEP